MTDGAVPAITLTNPHNKNAEFSPELSPPSPVKSAESVTSSELNDVKSRGVVFGRPGTATSTHESVVSNSRPDTGNRRPSTSGRLLRTNSNATSSPSRGPSASSSPHRQDAPQHIDPLSQQILSRTNGAQSLFASNILRPATADGATTPDDARKQNASSSPHQASLNRIEAQDVARKDLKKGVKAVSFLSRLIGNKKTDNSEDHAIDDQSVASDSRPEGMEAQVFAQPVDNMEYNPRHPQPPAYIKVRSKFKIKRDFDRLFLAQELHCSKKRKLSRVDSNKLRRKSSVTPEQDTVWAMEFSRDGKYLAAAGADMVVRVWQVLSSADERHRHEEADTDSRSGLGGRGERLSAPVFQSAPIREWEGHGATILDLSWSKNNFLLSSSMDKTVRLWHVTRPECLCTFKHNDFVPSIAFHPKDDRFFLAGSLDSRLRLWSIPDKSVAFSAQAPNMITAVAFTPDGKYAMVGCLNGQCLFYETEGLKYQTQIHVRSTRGQNARGSKITGIKAYHKSGGDTKLLITSNDSRVRIYNFRDKSLELKFKGNENNSSQIRASLSDCGRYVVCGSEDRKAYIWSMNTSEGDKRDKRPVEMFEAHDNITTCVCFAPTKTKHLLGKSEDPLYDLCNPPPVTLMSRAEQAESIHSSRPPTENGSVLHTPIEAEYRPKESVGYVARAAHRDGNVIVTADYSGNIKVFRQDCAWSKRRGEEWDRASMFSKRGGGASRNGSVITKSSQRSLRDGRTSASSHVAPSDRILSWRQGIASTPTVTNSEGSLRSAKGTSRSISPRKSQSSRPESHLRSATNNHDSQPSTKPSSLDANEKTPIAGAAHGKKDSGHEGSPNRHVQAFDFQENMNRRRDDDPMLVDSNGRSDLFWDSTRWKSQIEQSKLRHSANHQYAPDTDAPNGPPTAEVNGGNGRLSIRPALSETKSYVSALSVERSSFGGSHHGREKDDEDDEGDDAFDDAQEERPEDRMVCRRCGGVGFQAKRVGDGVRLVCQGCGLNVS